MGRKDNIILEIKKKVQGAQRQIDSEDEKGLWKREKGDRKAAKSRRQDTSKVQWGVDTSGADRAGREGQCLCHFIPQRRKRENYNHS